MSTRPWMYLDLPRAACSPHCPHAPPPPPVLNFHHDHSGSMLFCRNIPPNTCPPVRSRQVQDPLPGAAATQQCAGKFFFVTAGKCKDSHDRLEKTSARWTVDAAIAPPLSCSERPGQFDSGLVERRGVGLGGLRRWQGWTGYLLPTKATARLTDSLPSSHKRKKSVSPPWRDRMLWEHH